MQTVKIIKLCLKYFCAIAILLADFPLLAGKQHILVKNHLSPVSIGKKDAKEPDRLAFISDNDLNQLLNSNGYTRFLTQLVLKKMNWEHAVPHTSVALTAEKESNFPLFQASQSPVLKGPVFEVNMFREPNRGFKTNTAQIETFFRAHSVTLEALGITMPLITGFVTRINENIDLISSEFKHNLSLPFSTQLVFVLNSPKFAYTFHSDSDNKAITFDLNLISSYSTNALPSALVDIMIRHEIIHAMQFNLSFSDRGLADVAQELIALSYTLNDIAGLSEIERRNVLSFLTRFGPDVGGQVNLGHWLDTMTDKLNSGALIDNFMVDDFLASGFFTEQDRMAFLRIPLLLKNDLLSVLQTLPNLKVKVHIPETPVQIPPSESISSLPHTSEINGRYEISERKQFRMESFKAMSDVIRYLNHLEEHEISDFVTALNSPFFMDTQLEIMKLQKDTNLLYWLNFYADFIEELRPIIRKHSLDERRRLYNNPAEKLIPADFKTSDDFIHNFIQSTLKPLFKNYLPDPPYLDADLYLTLPKRIQSLIGHLGYVIQSPPQAKSLPKPEKKDRFLTLPNASSASRLMKTTQPVKPQIKSKPRRDKTQNNYSPAPDKASPKEIELRRVQAANREAAEMDSLMTRNREIAERRKSKISQKQTDMEEIERLRAENERIKRIEIEKANMDAAISTPSPFTDLQSMLKKMNQLRTRHIEPFLSQFSSQSFRHHQVKSMLDDSTQDLSEWIRLFGKFLDLMKPKVASARAEYRYSLSPKVMSGPSIVTPENIDYEYASTKMDAFSKEVISPIIQDYIKEKWTKDIKPTLSPVHISA